MRFNLGFAEAAATLYHNIGFRENDPYTIVVGVEDSARVRYHQPGNEVVDLPESWQRLKKMADEDMRLINEVSRTVHTRQGFFRRLFGLGNRMIRGRGGIDSGMLNEALDIFEGADREADRHLAHNILARDSTASTRTVATLVLANFADRDSTRHALAASLTDPDPRVGSVARNLLDALIARRPMPVDWSGARESLAALLDGTAASTSTTFSKFCERPKSTPNWAPSWPAGAPTFSWHSPDPNTKDPATAA